MADPIAEAFVQIRPDMTIFGPQLQAGITQALQGLQIPANVQQKLGSQIFGPTLAQQVQTSTTQGAANTKIPTATQRTLAQQLFGPGFRDESGRAIQGTLAGLGLGQLAAQFAFFGPGGAALAVLGGAFLATAKSGAVFEQQMDILQATSGATAEELEALSQKAIALGADIDLPNVSAADAAAAMTELAKAGLSVEDVFGGVQGVLQLSTAANISSAQAAKISASALNAFSLAGTEASHVADLLAGASVAAQGDIGDMALALQQSAAVADQAGLTLEQLVALITELAKQGILGSDAGTSIRTGLLRLIPTTKEAALFMEALGIELDQTRTLGEQLPEVLDQYNRALGKLNPILRQNALTQIFGTDAIRFATTAIEQGSKGLQENIDQTDKQGAAAELAGARTKGLAGAAGALVSNVQTLATSLGNEVAPALTDYINLLNLAIGTQDKANEVELTPAQQLISNAGVNDLKDAVALMDILDDRITEVGTNKTAEEAFARLSAKLLAADRSGEEIRRLFQGTSGDLAQIGRAMEDGVIGPIEIAKLGATELGRIFLQALKPKNLTSDIPDETQRALQKAVLFAKPTGKKLGQDFGDGIAEGITDKEQEIIDAARRNLADVQRAGNEQITASITSARSNLESLGSSLGGALEEIIDTGPIADAIADIDKQLDALQERTTRRQLRFDFSEAKADLRDAADSIQQVGFLTPKQKREQEEFLKPFQEKVKDAKASLKEFDLEDHRKDLEETIEKQKEAANEGVQVLIDKFEEGKISVGEFDAILSKQLGPHLATLAANKANLGFVFTRDFKRDMATLVAQAEALAGFTGRPGTTPGTTVERPAQTVADVQRQLTSAQRELTQAIKDAKADNTAQNGQLASLLKQIRDAVKGTPTKQRSERPN